MKERNHKQITVFSGAVLKEGRILMSLRNEEGCSGAHMKWELPGGKAEASENAEEAVLREILEETGVQAKVIDLIPIAQTHHWNYDWGTQQTFCFYYLCDYVSETGKPRDHKVIRYEWFPLEEALMLDSLPGTSEVIDHIITFNKISKP